MPTKKTAVQLKPYHYQPKEGRTKPKAVYVRLSQEIYEKLGEDSSRADTIRKIVQNFYQQSEEEQSPPTKKEPPEEVTEWIAKSIAPELLEFFCVSVTMPDFKNLKNRGLRQRLYLIKQLRTNKLSLSELAQKTRIKKQLVRNYLEELAILGLPLQEEKNSGEVLYFLK